MTDFHYMQNVDNSRLVRAENPGRRREQRLLGVAVGAMFLLLFGYAWQNFEIVSIGFKVEQVRRQEAGLQEWNRALRLEQASLRDPIRIYGLAEARLGMESAQPGQVARLEDPLVTRGAPVMAEARLPRTRQ